MPQLLVRKIEAGVVQKLRLRAARDGVSMEEEHRRILRGALLRKSAAARAAASSAPARKAPAKSRKDPFVEFDKIINKIVRARRRSPARELEW